MRICSSASLCALAGIIFSLVLSQPLAAQGDKWAIIIGVGDYEDATICDLPYAPNDARLLYQMLIERGDFQPSNIRLMVDDSTGDLRPTNNNIRSALDTWVRLHVKEGDTILFYFSGHGAAGKDTGYLIPIDARYGRGGDEIPSTSVDLNLVRDRLADCAASQVVAILDSCFSGLGKDTGVGMAAEFAKAVRIVPDEPLPEGKVRVTLTSCRAQEQSWPLDLLAPVSSANRSVFTYYLFAGLEGPAETSPSDGVITAREAYDYAHKCMAEWVARNKVPQTPDISVYPEDLKPDVPLVNIPTRSLEVTSDPPGAGIFLDEQDTRRITPAVISSRLSPGQHSVGLKPPEGYDPWQQQVVVPDTGKAAVKAVLQRHGSSARIASDPPAAKIFLDGLPTGKITPAEVFLSPGNHAIRLELEGYDPWEKQVTALAGQAVDVAAQLRRVTGSVVVTSDPSGASIIVDGEQKGITPLQLWLLPGQYTIRLELQGYEPGEGKATIVAGQTTQVSAALSPPRGTLAVTSDPPGATIIVDGEEKGLTPAEIPLAPGGHIIRLVLQGYDDQERTLSIPPGQRTALAITLTPTEGRVSVTSVPAGAKVLLDGRDTGRTTPAEFPLPAGLYAVRLEADGYQPVDKPLLVASGKTAQVAVNLQPLPATVTINSTPSGATITLQGEDKGVTPATISLAPGTYTLRLELKDYKPEDKSLSLAPNQTLSLDIPLTPTQPQVGTISVNASPWADVFLDDAKVGTTPLTIKDVSAGSHKVRLEYQGSSFEADVTVKAGETTTVSHFF